MVKICAISDVHGQWSSVNIEPCDILFIGGDIVPLKMQRNVSQSFSWFEKKFIKWCKAQPVDQIYMVAGNHDFFLKNEQTAKECLRGTNITILYNEGAEYLDNDGKIWTIWGSPLCHIFGNWAFMYSDEYNKEQYEKMPNNVDFLLTHDAAYEHSDQCLQFIDEEARNLHRGNIALKEVVEKKNPRYHFQGHLHSCNHEIVDYNGTKTVCVSLLDETYFMGYKPLYLTIE